ncbi:MAG: deoxyguanosinetriphosphate triphosphohydrolase [Granulosicoccaceae bacterium]|jgi:dGTPase
MANTLAAYAAIDAASRGRRFQESSPTYRGEFQRDRDRIIHSTAFRRLEYKTQVFVNHEGDLFRTRLTHSIEVAQIARTISRALGLNEDLAEAIALAHDLGHTPFGHAGQDILNECMRDYGGFEHNLQSLRVVDELEEKYAEFPGLNLTFEAREGILKHCSLKNARELGEIGQRFLQGTHPSLEAQLVNLGDEIAYNSHDVDDGLRSGLIGIEQLREIELFGDLYDEVTQAWPDLPERRVIYETVRRLISYQVIDLVETSRHNIDSAQPADIDAVRAHKEALVAYSTEMRERNLALKRFLRKNLYQHYRVRRMSAKASRIIRELFEAFHNDPQLLPDEYAARVSQSRHDVGDAAAARVIADYIAGMTDRFAIAEHEKIYNPKQLT